MARREEPFNSEWGGLGQYTTNMVAPDDPELDRVHDNYRQNLRDITRAGTDAGARVVLSTVAVNIKDSPPFASLGDSLLAEPARSEWRAALKQGALLQKQGRMEDSRGPLERAADLFPDHAETRFRLGKAILATGEASQAVPHLLAALELDILRFRADRRRNLIVQEVVQEMADAGAAQFDHAALKNLESNVTRKSGVEGHPENIPGGIVTP